MHLYAVVFALESLADSFSTGPLSRWLGIAGTSAGTATTAEAVSWEATATT